MNRRKSIDRRFCSDWLRRIAIHCIKHRFPLKENNRPFVERRCHERRS